MARLYRWLPVLMVVALLGAAMVATLYANPGFEDSSGGVATHQPDTPDAEQQLPTPDQITAQPPPLGGDWTLPRWATVLLASLCILVVVGLIVAILWSTLGQRLHNRREVLKVADPDEMRRRVQESMRAAVDEGLADLDITDRDPRRAVIACWVRLEAAAAAAGTEREPGDTSTDLVERVLAGHAVTPEVLGRLAALYREARFAPHVVDEAMREQARAALLRVRDELTAEVGQ